MAGRIGVYVHSDSITPDKGACIVVVRTATDFASRTSEVKDFADRVAKLAYGTTAGVTDPTWTDVVVAFPDIEQERKDLATLLRETVNVTGMASLQI